QLDWRVGSARDCVLPTGLEPAYPAQTAGRLPFDLTTAPGRLCPGRNPRPIQGSDLPGGGKRRWRSQPDAPVGGVVLQQGKVRDVYSARPDSGAIVGSQKRNLGAGSESRARAQRPSQPKKTMHARVRVSY